MSGKMKLFWNNVAGFKFHYWWLVIVSTIVHRLPFWLYAPTEAVVLKKIAMIVSYVILTFVLLRNLKTWGFRLMLVGVLLNFTAVGFNGWLMPVTPEARLSAGMSSIDQAVVGGVLPEGSGILLTAEQTRLRVLTDFIPIEKLGAVCSIGDLIILGGMIVLGIQIIYKAYPRTILKKRSPIINHTIEGRENL
jgi:hypothetical protein